MARIMCIDYGGKRTGIAVTDELQIIATALTTVESKNLISFLKEYFANNTVELLLMGYPLDLNDKPTHATGLVNNVIQLIKKHFPQLSIITVDERFTSKMASKAMVEMGMKKKDRHVKQNVDKIAATIMLQEYLANK